MSDKPVSYYPSEGLSYDPNEEKYWDPQALDLEVERAFEICHGCRMCFKYCDSFPDLFKFIDANDGDVRRLNKEQVDQVMNSCFQCKLCEVQCPYTPRDKHDFQLDFPKLVHRYQAQKFKRQGEKPSLQQKALADPYKAGALARKSFGLANKMNRVKLHRWFLEKLVGIHREKLLPEFSSQTFSDIAEKKGWVKEPEQGQEAVFFPTCYVDNNEPEIGEEAMAVLEKNEVQTVCSKGLDCCGMPHWEYGNLEQLRKQAKHNISKLLPYVEKGAKVLVVNPTCSMMMRQEYCELLEEEWKEKAEKVAKATLDVTDYLWQLRGEGKLAEAEHQPSEKVSYHMPCHLRAQAKGFRGRDLVKKLGGAKVIPVMECCGHDGTYAMKKESFESAKKIGEKSFQGMKSAEGEIWVTDCPLAAIQFEQHAGVKPLHPIRFIAKCYGVDKK